jgi:hypothetical protein
MRNFLRIGAAAVVLSGMVAAVGASWAFPNQGPPLVCHPIDIGDAKSIPRDDGKARDYTPRKAIDDTLAILKTEKSLLVRMETLRRATMYVHEDLAAATELLAKLAWMTLDAEAQPESERKGTGAATAWFDAGYLAACYGQLGVDVGWKPGVESGIQGYAWIRKAAALNPDSPEIQFVGALATMPGMHPSAEKLYREHVLRAAELAPKGSLVEKNLSSHLAIWGDSLEKIRAEAAKDGRQIAEKGKPTDGKKPGGK